MAGLQLLTDNFQIVEVNEEDSEELKVLQSITGSSVSALSCSQNSGTSLQWTLKSSADRELLKEPFEGHNRSIDSQHQPPTSGKVSPVLEHSSIVEC